MGFWFVSVSGGNRRSPGGEYASLSLRSRWLSRGHGEAPPGWVLGGACPLWPWQGVSRLMSGSWSTACQSDMRGLGTAGRCFGGNGSRCLGTSVTSWSRVAHRSVAGSFLALPPARVPSAKDVLRGLLDGGQ